MTTIKRFDSAGWRLLALVLACVALCLTGVQAVVAAKQSASQTERLCNVVGDLLTTLDTRSDAGAAAQDKVDDLWKDQRRVLIGLGASPDDPIIQNIDEYLAARAEQKHVIQTDEYPADLEGVCDVDLPDPAPDE